MMGVWIPPEDALDILRLRLLIARAAQSDSLAWWDDNSLTPSGDFILARLLANAPGMAARRLALQAAHARHQAVFANFPDAIHLFRLDLTGEAELAMRSIPLNELDVPQEKIASIDELHSWIERVVHAPPKPAKLHALQDGRLQIALEKGLLLPSPLGRARLLAWAYLEGKVGKSVFPFLQGGT